MVTPQKFVHRFSVFQALEDCVACVQTFPLPQEKSGFFLREGGRLQTG